MWRALSIFILKSVRYRPVRSWLTILGIVIGVTLVVVILSLGSGIKNAVAARLQMFGTDLIVVFPGKESNPFIGFISGQKFRVDDLLALEQIPGVKCVDPEVVETLTIEYKGEKQSTLFHTITACTIEIVESSQGFQLEEGRWPLDANAREAVLGASASRNLFQERVRLGNEVIVGAKRLKVVGIAKPLGEQTADNIIYIPFGMYRDVTGEGRFAQSGNIKVMPDANVDLVAKQVRFELEKQSVVRDFSVLTAEKADRIVGDVLSIIELSLSIIALVSLLVGAVGIMNTMYTSVLERTKQIGIMKAIGASNDAILFLFLLESGMIGVVGGLLGIIFGVAGAAGIGLAAAQFGVKGLFSFAALDFFGFLVIVIITFTTGVIAGILPARRAAKMEPAEALRYE